MSDYDDMLNDYDWHQNTGELGEYFDGGGDDGGRERYGETGHNVRSFLLS